jgi:hypothetical protein
MVHIMDGQDGQDKRTLCHYIQDGDAMQLSSAPAFGARDLRFRLPGVWVAWKGMGWIAHTSHHVHSLAFLDAGG